MCIMQIQLYLDARISEYIGPTQNNHENLFSKITISLRKPVCKFLIKAQNPVHVGCISKVTPRYFPVEKFMRNIFSFFLFDIISMRMPADAGCVVLENCVSF